MVYLTQETILLEKDIKLNSKYKPEQKITVRQYIVERICEFNAIKSGRDLPYQFWLKDDIWKEFFKIQSIRICQLAKKYAAEAILNTIINKKIYNAFPKWIEEEIQKEEKRLAVKYKDMENYVPIQINDKFCVGYTNKGRDLDYLD